MITEPLISEITVYPDGKWDAVAMDSEGQPVTDRDFDKTLWKRDMLRALAVISLFHQAPVLMIVHPSGYARC